MNETRRARLQSVIQEELAQLISRQVKDPRVPAFVSVTSVDVTKEGDHATIFISAMGVDAKSHDMRHCLAGLTAASHFFRKQLASVLNIRHVPSLTFKADIGLQNTQRVAELLKQIEEERKSSS